MKIKKLAPQRPDENIYLSRNKRQNYAKAERRYGRYLKNISKQTLEQQLSGKLIEENHNGKDYSYEFTCRAISWYLGLLYMRMNKLRYDKEKFGIFFMKVCREKLQTLLLHWPDERERDWSFYFFMDLLDTYREKKENSYEELWNKCAEMFNSKGLEIKE